LLIAVLAADSMGYPPLLVKARKFGAKDCTFCHVDPEGGPPWNERGQWLVDEKERRKADAVDVEWLVNYKPTKSGGTAAKKQPATAAKTAEAAGDGSSTEQDLLKLEREWLDSYIKGDEDTMARIESDDFTITYQDGSVRTKSDELANLKKRTGPPDPSLTMSTEDVKVRIYGDTAVLTGVFVAKSAEHLERSRYTDVYVKKDGAWRVVASHLTSVKTPPPPPAPASAEPKPAFDTKAYDDYQGEYELPIFTLVITREGDKLFAQPPGDSKEELIPESETQFSVTNVNAKVRFVRDDTGRVSHILVNLNGEELTGKKVK
jgi:ketosteroid isomerase-like protein